MPEPGDPMSEDVALVTGGTRGIGRATVRLLAERGATVVANYYSDHDAAERTAQEFADLPGEVTVMQFDVADYDAVAGAVAEIEEDHGDISILVNNAGIMQNTLLMRMDPAQWQAVVDTNLTGTFNCTREVGRSMVLGDGGSIVCVSSIAAQHGWAGQSNYAASKAGIEGFVRSLAREMSSGDVRVNAVAPGYTQTELYEERAEGATPDDIPMERTADPVEIAEAICFLASDRASYITGETLRADGGRLA